MRAASYQCVCLILKTITFFSIYGLKNPNQVVNLWADRDEDGADQVISH